MSQDKPTQEQMGIIKYLAAFAVRPSFRTPVHIKPEERGMNNYEDIYFQSDDGIPLEGWLLKPQTPSNKLIIANHPMPMSRSGFTGHYGEPWSGVDNIEIDFVAAYAHLVNAGYNVLAYDLRNHGNSSSANGGICGIGRYEWRDCVGVKEYVDNHPELKTMTIGLLSRCTGGNAQYEAIHRRPDLFENVTCLMSPLVVSMEALMGTFSKLQGVGDFMELLNFEQKKLGGFTNEEMTPKLFAPSVKLPVFMSQVKDDMWTDNPRDGQEIFDLLGSRDKELFWIEGTTRRFDGYNYFGKKPEKMIAFFDKYMK